MAPVRHLDLQITAFGIDVHSPGHLDPVARSKRCGMTSGAAGKYAHLMEASLSLSVRYTCPDAGIERLLISPDTQTPPSMPPSALRIRATAARPPERFQIGPAPCEAVRTDERRRDDLKHSSSKRKG